jgi:hypothetical protein
MKDVHGGGNVDQSRFPGYAAMTTAGQGRTPTALDLLFGPDADAAETLAGEILSPGGDQSLGRAIAHLSETTRQAAAQEAATTMAALLKADLAGVLVGGWREHRDIVSAARRTLAAPGRTELVSMATHEVTLDQRPSVGVLVDGLQVATVQFGLSIAFDVNALLLGISGGRLVTVRSGRCDITATLAVQGTDLFVRHAHLELPDVFRLRRGIRLLPVDAYPAGEDVPSEFPGSEPAGGEYTGSEERVSGYPAGTDDPPAPWWLSAQSVPPQDRRT